MKRLLPFLLIPAALWGDAGEVEIRERNSSNRTVVNQIATGAGNRVLVIDDSNAQGAKVEGAAIGSGLSFDGTTLTATAASRATTDLAGGTALSANVDYYDTFAADRTNLAVWGTPTDGQYSTITFDVTGATRSIGFNSTTVYRLGESSSSTGPWNFPVGNHKITLARMDGKWFLIDSAVDTEAANVFLASPDGTTGPMSPRAIVDGDIPAAIARDSEIATDAAVVANTAKVSNATHTGDVTGSGALTIANDAVTNAKSANMADSTIKGRAAGAGTGDPTDLSAAQVKTILGIAASSSPEFNGVNIGDSADTTVTRSAAGVIDVEGKSVGWAETFTEQLGAGHTVSISKATGEGYGSVHYITANATIVLPAVTTGTSFTFIAVGAVTITVDPNAADLIMRDGTAQSDGVTVVSPGASGDVAVFTYYGATGWFCSSNTWTEGS